MKLSSFPQLYRDQFEEENNKQMYKNWNNDTKNLQQEKERKRDTRETLNFTTSIVISSMWKWWVCEEEM